MRDPYKLRLGEYMHYPGVDYYVMTMRGVCICDTWQEKDELVAEALSYKE
jgi:hypothetical protein